MRLWLLFLGSASSLAAAEYVFSDSADSVGAHSQSYPLTTCNGLTIGSTTSSIEVPSSLVTVCIYRASLDETVHDSPPSIVTWQRSISHGLDTALRQQTRIAQTVFSKRLPLETQLEVLHQAGDRHTIVLSLPSWLLPRIDELLPSDAKVTLVSSTPLEAVPKHAIERLEQLTASLRFSPKYDAALSSMSEVDIAADLAVLTGQRPDAPWITRHSYTSGARQAAHWLRKQIEQDERANCTFEHFRAAFAPNVICRFTGRKSGSKVVILSAHLDSRGTFGEVRAPGADDDGSGTGGILAVARAIRNYVESFEHDVMLCLFAGEEQGLVGSRAFAPQVRAAGLDVIIMLQSDMIAYRKPGEPLQLGFPADGTATAAATDLVSNISSMYAPQLRVGPTRACCSDHQSFFEQGLASTQLFERAGDIALPVYHDSHDLTTQKGYDFYQLKSIAQVMLATVLVTGNATIV
ncbi:uncharacterized protein L969DRAFT_16339 [Mixia osmundae IAM 14324]|uniref:Peptide hydrolase n=1 Tax=Mixia osmundae (strain CBS 9802 / IAM 14324 / JCM 22182 / KY 12970) TaxID=764103 RepID=G7DU60_MIXOS|nr:uncharacterized protein L969DRAFT_16339 [Mixia osmundae IAM 14324]KEI40987.1 hypothetical protein L969DRAFT_16339 [Mixia osmundae IAM 14324]GAA94120.1 hypothetical protein E5Q_00768 [Mixia osmundae IAM 14324]